MGCSFDPTLFENLKPGLKTKFTLLRQTWTHESIQVNSRKLHAWNPRFIFDLNIEKHIYYLSICKRSKKMAKNLKLTQWLRTQIPQTRVWRPLDFVVSFSGQFMVQFVFFPATNLPSWSIYITFFSNIKNAAISAISLVLYHAFDPPRADAILVFGGWKSFAFSH